MKRFIHWYRYFASARSGATMLETAFVLPIVILLMIGIVEFCLVVFASSVLQGALIEGSREGKTGYVNSNFAGTPNAGFCPEPSADSTNWQQAQMDFIRCIITSRVTGLLDPTKLEISATAFGSDVTADSFSLPATTACSNASPNNSGLPACTENLGGPGDFVIYSVTYPWSLFTPLISGFLGQNGVYNVVATAMVKNEMYTPPQ